MTTATVTSVKATAGKPKGKGKPAGKAGKDTGKPAKGKEAPAPVSTRGKPLDTTRVTVEGVKANAAAVKKAAVTVNVTAAGAAHGTIYGYAITRVVRTLAYHGVSRDGVRKVLAAFNTGSREGMLKSQYGDGVRHANGIECFYAKGDNIIAPLTPAELKHLKSLAGE